MRVQRLAELNEVVPAPQLPDDDVRGLAEARERAIAAYEAAMVGGRPHGLEIDIQQPEDDRPGPRPDFWDLLLQGRQEPAGTALTPPPGAQARRNIPPPQRAPRVAQPLRQEQLAGRLENPVQRPPTLPQALPPVTELPLGYKQYVIDAVADAPPPRQIRNPVFRQTQAPLPHPRPYRKSLDEPCYVCYEDFEGPEDALWCHRGCGQNVHVECFGTWRQTHVHERTRCPFW